MDMNPNLDRAMIHVGNMKLLKVNRIDCHFSVDSFHLVANSIQFYRPNRATTTNLAS